MVNHIVPLLLALGGPSETTRVETTRVEVHEADAVVSVLLYDHDDEVAVELVTRHDDSEVMFDVIFPDGLYLSIVTDGENATIESEDVEEVERRLAKIDPGTQTMALPEWVPCAGHAFFAAGSCLGGVILVCAGETFLAACECIEYATGGENSCYG